MKMSSYIISYVSSTSSVGPYKAEEVVPSNEELKIYVSNKLTYSGTLNEVLENFNRFKQKIEKRAEKTINVLSEAIRSLRVIQDYNGLYTAYLLDQLSEEEFIEESEKYAFEPKTELTEEIVDKIDILLRCTGEKFSPSDLSDIFKIDVSITEKALEKNFIAHTIRYE